MVTSQESINSAVTDLNEYMSNLFGGYQFTGDRQKILSGMFKWLKENKYGEGLSVGELRSALRQGFPEVLDYDNTDLLKK